MSEASARARATRIYPRLAGDSGPRDPARSGRRLLSLLGTLPALAPAHGRRPQQDRRQGRYVLAGSAEQCCARVVAWRAVSRRRPPFLSGALIGFWLFSGAIRSGRAAPPSLSMAASVALPLRICGASTASSWPHARDCSALLPVVGTCQERGRTRRVVSAAGPAHVSLVTYATLLSTSRLLQSIREENRCWLLGKSERDAARSVTVAEPAREYTLVS